MSFEVDGVMYEDFFEGGRHYLHRFYDHQVRRIPEERRMEALEDLVPSLFDTYNIVTEVTDEEVLLSARAISRKMESLLNNTFHIDYLGSKNSQAVSGLRNAIDSFCEYVRDTIKEEER